MSEPAQEKTQVPSREPSPAPSDGAGKQHTGPSKNALKKRARQLEKEKNEAEKAAKDSEVEHKVAKSAEPDFAVDFYGKLPLNQSQTRLRRERTNIATLTTADDGASILVQARVQTSRKKGTKMVFLHLRQRTDSIQALLILAPEKVSEQMINWAASLADESIVLIEGVVTKVPKPITSTSISDVEIHVSKIHLVASVEARLPFSLDDASRAETFKANSEGQFNNVLLDTRLNNRVLDLRTSTNQAIFRLQHGVTELFREYLDRHGFIEIHSPKLQGAATESGASVFQVDYFKGKAFLAQSPQLAKQMAISADFERVYEIGPVFRAENAFTHRDMTEFMGLDLEMKMEEHYHEVLEMIDGLMLHIFRGLSARYAKEIATVKKQFPADDFKWRDGPEGTLRLTFAQAVDLLVESGIPREYLDDIDTSNEKKLGLIVRDKFETDYFIIDQFPTELRPFYTMPNAENPTLSNSFDFFMRGEEILSGAQRIHDPTFLTERIQASGIQPESMAGYINAFKMGCPPHGGGGLGLERILMFFLKLNNIRRASLFPRDPKRLEP